MKNIYSYIKYLIKSIFIFLMFFTMVYADDKLDKLLQIESVAKLSYKHTKDNTADVETFNGYLRYKDDLYIDKVMLLPIIEGKYEKRNGKHLYNKHDISLLAECKSNIWQGGYYSKYSNIVDEANKIENKNKYGIGVYQLFISNNKFVIKFREGIQFINTEYKNYDNTNSAYLKLGILSGYKVNDTLFLKLKVDYDTDIDSDDKLLESGFTSELSLNKKLSIEFNYKYERYDKIDNSLKNTETELGSYLVYKF